MSEAARSWWRNCAAELDPEILQIDRMEDSLSPLPPNVSRIRELISTLELCHHQAERWVENIVQAIGLGQTTKGLGTRSPSRSHPVERVWQNACASLSACCAGSSPASIRMCVGAATGSHLLTSLGHRTPLKEWQVQRVVEKVRSFINWPRSPHDPSSQYVWILECGSEYESALRSECPEHFIEHQDYWSATVQTMIHDTENGNEAELSLALAIDMLMPCHWNFVENLEIALGAIGGNLHPERPYSACARNMALAPIRRRMRDVRLTLMAFCSDSEQGKQVDRQMLALLGEPTEVKKWLAASLDKTIRVQLSL